MSARTLLGAVALVVVTAVVTTQVVSQDTGKMEKGKKETTPQLPPGMTPEMAAKFEAAGKIGPQHEVIKKLAGTWTYSVKFRMDETQPWIEETGKTQTKAIMGGRFTIGDSSGVSSDGQPFEGMGINGYDNVSNKYVCVWLCNCGTGIQFMEGTADTAGKVITYTGTCNCPIEGAGQKGKWVQTTVDDNHFNFDGYSYKGGKEWKCMEIHYTRAGTK